MASIRKRNGRYQAQVRRRGYSPASRTFTNLATANKWIKSVEVDLERGEFLPRVTMTVNELLLRYEAEEVPKQKGARHEFWRSSFLRKQIGHIHLRDLTPAFLATHRDRRLKTVKASTVSREFTTLSTAINTAIVEWAIPLPNNPVSKVRVRNADIRRDRRLGAGEEGLMLKHAQPMLQRVIVLALETAMRRGEILKIKRSDINFSTQTLYIGDTKTATPRTIPLSEKAVKTLREQMRALDDELDGVIPIQEPLLFQIHLSEWQRQMERLWRDTGIKNLKFHDLRHEAISRLFESGFNVMEVATISGHKCLQHLKRYTHIKPESLVARLG
jgi:integrase